MNEPTDTTKPRRWKRFLAERLAVGGAPAFVLGWMRRVVLADPSARAYYESLRRAEQIASGRAFGPGQADLVERLVLDAATPRPRTAPAFGLAAMAAAALLFVVTRPEEKDDLLARGAEPPALGVKVRCVDQDASRVVASAEAGPRVPVDALACPAGTLLSFSFTNLDKEPRHVFVVGVAADGALRWFAPFDEGASSILVAPGAVDEPLAVGADMRALPKDERVTLFALFSARPLSGGSVARTLRATSVPLGAASQLPFDDVFQARIELRAEGP